MGFTSWHGSCNNPSETINRRHAAAGSQFAKERTMNNRNVQNGLVLAGALAVLFSLMFASSLVATNTPAGL
jgi:hypothetical protein